MQTLEFYHDYLTEELVKDVFHLILQQVPQEEWKTTTIILSPIWHKFLDAALPEDTPVAFHTSPSIRHDRAEKVTVLSTGAVKFTTLRIAIGLQTTDATPTK